MIKLVIAGVAQGHAHHLWHRQLARGCIDDRARHHQHHLAVLAFAVIIHLAEIDAAGIHRQPQAGIDPGRLRPDHRDVLAIAHRRHGDQQHHRDQPGPARHHGEFGRQGAARLGRDGRRRKGAVGEGERERDRTSARPPRTGAPPDRARAPRPGRRPAAPARSPPLPPRQPDASYGRIWRSAPSARRREISTRRRHSACRKRDR